MTRVLMAWPVGGLLNRYIYISRIPEDYLIPKFTDEMYFMEGRIIDGTTMDDYVIELTLRNEILTNLNGRNFIQII